MFRTADRIRANLLGRLRPRPDDEGFTLIEVLAALLLFALVASAAASMLVSGLRASLVAKLDTGAKNLAQERVEIMRNLPFHLDHDPAVAVGADKDDLLGNYYYDRSVAPSVTATGYVDACGPQTAVCPGRPEYDPPSGSFYRVVVPQVPGHPKYSQYVTTQFVDFPSNNRTPLAPPADYTSQVAGRDYPPSQIVAISVTTYWTAGKLRKSFQLQTLIAAGRPAAAQVTFQGRATALRIYGGLDAARLLSAQAGLVSIDGSLTSGATAASDAKGAIADITGGAGIQGSTASAAAPPNVSGLGDTRTAQTLWDGSRQVVYFGQTQSKQLQANISNSAPAVGSGSSYVTGMITAHGPGTVPFTYYHGVDMEDRLKVNETASVAWINQGSNSSPVAQSNGWGRTVNGASHSVESHVWSSALALRLFPTSFAPEGVLRVTLSNAVLDCTNNGTTAAGTLAYSAAVSYWNPSTNTYTPLSLNHTQGTSPLATTDPSTIVVHNDPVSGAVYLSDYIGEWRSLNSADVAAGVKHEGALLAAQYDGVVTITTKPTRTGDPTSALSIQLGLLSCVVEDNR